MKKPVAQKKELHSADVKFVASQRRKNWIKRRMNGGTEYTVDQPATFAADGSKSIHCKNCETISEAIAIPRINSVKISATAYTYSGGVKTPPVTVKDATEMHCTTKQII